VNPAESEWEAPPPNGRPRHTARTTPREKT